MWWNYPHQARQFEGCLSCPPVQTRGLGLLPGDQVTEYSATVTVANPSLFKDASGAALGLSDWLSAMGWNARVLAPKAGYLTASFKVILTKPGKKPFSAGDARAAIYAAAAQQSTSVKTFVENAAEAIKFVSEAPSTALSEKGRQQTKDTIDSGFGKFWDSIPTSVKVVGGLAIGLFALAQVASIAKAFHGVDAVEGGEI